jgi:hypothetical protein
MTIPAVSTFEIVGAPRRPGIADVGGAAFVDDQTDPPDAQTMPSAAMENQGEFLAVAYGMMVPVLRMTVTWNGSAYVLTQFQCPSTLVSTGTFTVTRNSVGNISITWPANTLPASAGQPTSSFTLAALLNNATIGSKNITNGVQTFITAGGAGSDQSYTVEVH